MKSFKAFIAEGENKQVKGGDPCWSGYEMVGKKKKNGKEVPNCVPVSEETVEESAAWQKKAGKNPEGGLNRKGIASYRAEHPGSHLSMAVTTPPSKLKPGSKAANRRKSFCARMGGMEGPMKKPNGEPTRKALALRKWNC
jgi:putative hemolysin